MGVSRYWNAAIALIEDNPSGAREILREAGVEDPGALQSRLYRAVGKTREEAVNNFCLDMLRESLRVVVPEGMDRESFYQGVRTVEKILEEQLEPTNLLVKDV